jgi:dGTP triphosphohydrolase
VSERDAGLAPYAASAANSRGRRHPEPPPALRTEFQRDRDRVIHSTAFRRLVYKTQVFVNYEGDLYRTRLTHSLEVAQIARTVARALRLNEDLVEAISLAHDLGHTPFGHAGQDALNERMRNFGGFEHNLQSLRVVDQLEDRYASFRGLNLTFETREGILKHCSLKHARELGDVGQRFLDRTQVGLEAQIANIADEIAYNNHDVDDGFRSGLITLEQLATLPFSRAPRSDLQASGLETAASRQRSRASDDRRARCGYRAFEHDRDRRSGAARDRRCPQAQRWTDRVQPGTARSTARSEAVPARALYTHPRVQQMTEQAHATVQFLSTSFPPTERMRTNMRSAPAAAATGTGGCGSRRRRLHWHD